MQKIKILSKKEIKNIKKKLDEQWGFSDDLNFTFLISNKGRINIVNQEVFDIDDTKLRIDSLGLYFATLIHNELRLSIEGSQIVGPKATKNVFEITDDDLIFYKNLLKLEFFNIWLNDALIFYFQPDIEKYLK